MAKASNADRSKLKTRPEVGLKVTFIALTCLFVLAGLINIQISKRISESNQDQIGVIERVGMLRLASQDVLAASQGIVDSKSVSQLIANQQQLAAACAHLDSAERELYSSTKFSSKGARNSFIGIFGPSRILVNRYDALAQSLLAELEPEKRTADLGDVSKADLAFDKSVDQATVSYSAKAKAVEVKEQNAAVVVLFSVFVIFVGFGMAAFYPSIKRVTAMVTLLRRLQAESEVYQEQLQIRQGELEEINETLIAQKEALMETSEMLQSMTEASQASARRFEELFQSIPVACMGFDRDMVVYDWNRESATAFGYEAYEVMHRCLWDFFGEEDTQFAKKLVKAVFRGKSFHNLEVSFPHRSGETRAFLLSIFPIRDQHSSIIGAIAACIDITVAKSRQDEVRQNAKTLRSLIASLEEGLLMVDNDSRIVVANDNAHRILEGTPGAFLGLRVDEMTIKTCDQHDNPVVAEEWPVMKTLRSGNSYVNQILGIQRPEQDTQWININTVPIVGEGHNGLAGAVVSFTDVSIKRKQEQALMEAYRRLEDLATTDGLTGLYNHRTFHEKLEESAGVEGTEKVALILMDVDHFKLFNDTYGHPAGDKVLKEVAYAIKQASPDGAIVARYGGEEFAVILPGYRLADAGRIAEEIRFAVESNPWPMREVTMSIGVAACENGDLKTTDLVTHADKALYSSKRGGRNRVTIDGHIPDLPDRRKAA